MSNRSNYNTKQKEILIDYLKSRKNEHVTVNEIKDYVNNKGLNVGLTTIYRQLEKLINEKIVAKITIDSHSGAMFEYIEQNKEDSNCYHLKCEVCNKIIHFHCNELNHIRHHMLEDHGFNINASKIVFYGVCNNCENQN